MIRKTRKAKNIKIVMFSMLGLLLLLTAGYAAFSTDLNIRAKGNIKMLQDLYVASYGSDKSGNGTISKPYASIQKAYNMAGNTASIHLLDDINQKEAINFSSDKEITLDSINNHSIVRDETLTSVLLNIDKGKVTFKNITFDGNNVVGTSALINITSESYIEDGAIFKNVNYSGTNGATIVIINTTLTMNGGEFFNNQTPNGGGAAIYIAGCRSSHFIMNGGSIHDNKSKDGAIWSNGIITMNGGKMYKNMATHQAGAIFSNGLMTMNNGEIYENSADEGGGGIACGLACNLTSELYIKGGKIYNNTANQGGGIVVHNNVIYESAEGTVFDNNPNDFYRNAS